MNPTGTTNKQSAPDYSFITQQPGPPNLKKKKNPKIVILIVLVVVTILVVIIGSLSRKNTKSVDNQQTTPQIKLVQQYMADVQADNKDAVLSAYTKIANVQTDLVEPTIIKPLKNNYKLAECTYSQEVKDITKVSAVCPLLSGTKKATLGFTILTVNGTAKINETRMVSIQ